MEDRRVNRIKFATNFILEITISTKYYLVFYTSRCCFHVVTLYSVFGFDFHGRDSWIAIPVAFDNDGGVPPL